MRALTVKQPWGDLIVTGVKDVENRTWEPPSTVAQWLVCVRCGRRSFDGVPETIPVTKHGRGTSVHWHDVCAPGPPAQGELVPDGPFPFTIAIHADKVVDRDAQGGTRLRHGWRPYASKGEMRRRLGAIVGTVDVFDCHHADDCAREFDADARMAEAEAGHSLWDGEGEYAWCSRWAEAGEWNGYHWMLDNARRLDEPIPAKGRQGLWLLDDQQVAAVVADRNA